MRPRAWGNGMLNTVFRTSHGHGNHEFITTMILTLGPQSSFSSQTALEGEGIYCKLFQSYDGPKLRITQMTLSKYYAT